MGVCGDDAVARWRGGGGAAHISSGDGAARGGIGGAARCVAIDWCSWRMASCIVSRVCARSRPTSACIAAAGCCIDTAWAGDLKPTYTHEQMSDEPMMETHPGHMGRVEPYQGPRGMSSSQRAICARRMPTDETASRKSCASGESGLSWSRWRMAASSRFVGRGMFVGSTKPAIADGPPTPASPGAGGGGIFDLLLSAALEV